MTNKTKNRIYYGIGGLLLLGIIYVFILITTPKPQIPLEYKIQIDSLSKVNNTLIERQKQTDSIISIYEGKIDQIDYKLDNIKEKTTIVKEYYHGQISSINNYVPQQIDSFFKNRYNY